jgi:hypothetical protein
MPSWRIHVTIGLCISILLIYICYYLDLSHLFVSDGEIQYFFVFHVCFISVLGSILPDYDYRKTRIRHSLGIILGSFVVVSIVYLYRTEPEKIDPIFLLFIMIAIVTVIFLLGLVVPFKHHGKMHSMSAAMFYGIGWIGLELWLFQMSILQAGVISLFGFVGFFFHLLLDQDLKMI